MSESAPFTIQTSTSQEVATVHRILPVFPAEPHSCDALQSTRGMYSVQVRRIPTCCKHFVRSCSSDPSCSRLHEAATQGLGFLRCRAPSTPHPPTRSPPVSAVTKARRSVLLRRRRRLSWGCEGRRRYLSNSSRPCLSTVRGKACEGDSRNRRAPDELGSSAPAEVSRVC